MNYPLTTARFTNRRDAEKFARAHGGPVTVNVENPKRGEWVVTISTEPFLNDRVYAEGIGMGRVERVITRKGEARYVVGNYHCHGTYAAAELVAANATPGFAALVAAADRAEKVAYNALMAYEDALGGDPEVRRGRAAARVTAERSADQAYRAVGDAAAELRRAQSRR